MPQHRLERDPLGPVQVPDAAYYGAQTARALDNFPISGLRPHAALVRATIVIKMACADANGSLGRLPDDVAGAITRACREVLRGGLRDQFVVDVYQAGAGTSHNMNANEVLANRAEELLGGKRGAYARVHPNDHVNMGQSTNDVFPTATRLAILIHHGALVDAAGELAGALEAQDRPDPSAGRRADHARTGVLGLGRQHPGGGRGSGARRLAPAGAESRRHCRRHGSQRGE